MMIQPTTTAEACVALAEEVAASHGVDPARGLTAAEVAHRRQLHGANTLPMKEADPLWRKFVDQFKDPMIGLLLASAGISLLLAQYDDALSICLVRGCSPRRGVC